MSIRIVNVRIPKEVTFWLDSLVQKGVYKSRAEAIREFSRIEIKKRGKHHG